jgi:chromosome segregation ATPase
VPSGMLICKQLNSPFFENQKKILEELKIQIHKKKNQLAAKGPLRTNDEQALFYRSEKAQLEQKIKILQNECNQLSNEKGEEENKVVELKIKISHLRTVIEENERRIMKFQRFVEKSSNYCASLSAIQFEFLRIKDEIQKIKSNKEVEIEAKLKKSLQKNVKKD